jgi:hypothetical protein
MALAGLRPERLNRTAIQDDDPKARHGNGPLAEALATEENLRIGPKRWLLIA